MLTRRALIALPAALPAAQAVDRKAIILERARQLSSFPGQRIGGAGDLEKASKIATGVVYFYSRTPVQVNLKDIDWSGKHIKHQEWPAQLNRFFHLSPLASAYGTTKEERFAQAARAYIEDWMREDPYANARSFRPGDNALSMSIRLGTSVSSGWGGTLPVFVASPAFDDAFLDQVFASIARQATHLSRYLTAAGNWRISELDALVFTALRFPFLSNSAMLLETGIAGMRNALATQFLPDGVHNERTPGYADWMTQVAVNYFLLAKIFPEADCRVQPERVVRSLDYGAQSELFGVNDSTAPHRDPSSLSRLSQRAEMIAKMGISARFEKDPPLDQVFGSAGQVFSRTAWKPGADYVAFDASTWGGGHSHLSRLSFVFRSKGRMLVADPGILTYEMSDPSGPYGKSTAAHSTLNVAGFNQSGADAQLLHTAFTADAALIHARYQGGYWKGRFTWGFGEGRGEGIYGDHERILFWVKGEYLLVLDAMTTAAGQEIRNCWQLGPMEKWSQDASALRWRSQNRDVNIALQMVIPPSKTVMESFEGKPDSLRGRVGWHGNDSTPAPLVEFRYPAPSERPVTSAVLIEAFTGDGQPACSAAVRTAPRSTVQQLEITLPSGAKDLIAWTTGLALPIDDGKPFTSDATFVWTRNVADGKRSKQFLLNGTYLRAQPTI
jgi:hypothetical protein